MNNGTEDLDHLIALMAKLPGLGPRSARRAVLHLIKKRALVLLPLADAMQKVGSTVRECLNCGNVTTAELAAQCGIAEGNLWYHFKNKRALLEAITARFLEDVEGRLALLPSDPDTLLNDYAQMLSALMSEIREYRFLYRVQADYADPTVQSLNRLPGI